MAVLYPAISLMLWGTQLLNSLSSQMAPSSVSVKILLSSLIVWSKVYPSTSRKLVHRHEDGSVALSRRVVERDKLPYEIIVVLIRQIVRQTTYLSEYDFFGSQLPEQCL